LGDDAGARFDHRDGHYPPGRTHHRVARFVADRLSLRVALGGMFEDLGHADLPAHNRLNHRLNFRWCAGISRQGVEPGGSRTDSNPNAAPVTPSPPTAARIRDEDSVGQTPTSWIPAIPAWLRHLKGC